MRARRPPRTFTTNNPLPSQSQNQWRPTYTATSPSCNQPITDPAVSRVTPFMWAATRPRADSLQYAKGRIAHKPQTLARRGSQPDLTMMIQDPNLRPLPTSGAPGRPRVRRARDVPGPSHVSIGAAAGAFRCGVRRSGRGRPACVHSASIGVPRTRGATVCRVVALRILSRIGAPSRTGRAAGCPVPSCRISIVVRETAAQGVSVRSPGGGCGSGATTRCD